MAKVWNRHHPCIPKDAILITRETPYGNPFKIPRDGNRQQVIRKLTDEFTGIKGSLQAPLKFEELEREYRGQNS